MNGRNSNETWVEAAIAHHAAAAGEIGKCIGDEGAFEVGQVLARHGLVQDRLYGDDLDQLHRLIADMATRLLRERIIQRMVAIDENPEHVRDGTRRELTLTLISVSRK